MGTTIMEEATTITQAMVNTVTADMVKIDFPNPSKHSKENNPLLPLIAL